MNDIITDILKMGLGWTVERCEHNCSIVIAGFGTPCATEAKLAEHFNSGMRGTVVKEVRILEKNSKWFAKVTFKNPSGIRTSQLVHVLFIFIFCFYSDTSNHGSKP